jgi:1,4-dihydroxy-2-naphthoate octaprenyltransferase
MSTAVATPSPIAAWALATRPKTLVAAIVPVAVGAALPWREGTFSLWPTIAALVGALFIQVGTNLVNDYYDFKRGADTAERLGPARATQQGWLSPRAVITGAFVCFALSMLVGLYLVSVGGLPILIIGLVSILAGYSYTGGPFPLGYNGLGDLFVLIFFGFVAVGGTYFLNAHELKPVVMIAALPVGLLGVALLAVNNTRDAKTDVQAGKRTLVVRFGVGFGKAEYVACLGLSALVPVALLLTGQAKPWVLLPLLAAPLAIPPLKVLFTQTGSALNQALAGTARLQLVFGVLFAVGLAQ